MPYLSFAVLPDPSQGSGRISAFSETNVRTGGVRCEPRRQLQAANPAPKIKTVFTGPSSEEDGWIAVDLATFATKFENVYAVGDVTSAPAPRVGAIAEGEARTLADVLVHQIRGGAAPEPYKGMATCYIEFGGPKVARFEANFLSGPSPVGTFTEPSEEFGGVEGRIRIDETPAMVWVALPERKSDAHGMPCRGPRVGESAKGLAGVASPQSACETEISN